MKKILVIHPFLFAIYPILFLFAHNREWLPDYTGVLAPLLIALVVTTIFFLAQWATIRDSNKAGVMVSLFLLLFFSYGHLYEINRAQPLGIFFLEHHRYLLVLFAILFALGTYLTLRTRKIITHFLD